MPMPSTGNPELDRINLEELQRLNQERYGGNPNIAPPAGVRVNYGVQQGDATPTPMQDKLDAINAEAEAAAKAEKETIEATVVEAKLATEEARKEQNALDEAAEATRRRSGDRL